MRNLFSTDVALLSGINLAPRTTLRILGVLFNRFGLLMLILSMSQYLRFWALNTIKLNINSSSMFITCLYCFFKCVLPSMMCFLDSPLSVSALVGHKH